MGNDKVPTPEEIAITPNGEFAYVASYSPSGFTVINTDDKSTTTFTLGSHLYGVAITPDGLYAYMTDYGATTPGIVYIIDTSNNQVTATVTVGGEPQGLAIYEFTTPIPPVDVLLPPRKLSGSQQKGNFGLVYELYNSLEWKSSPSEGVTGYIVRWNGKESGLLNASTRSFTVHNVKKGSSTLYSVTAVDSEGNESDPVTITIN